MNLNTLNIKYCSLFPDIDFNQTAGVCAFPLLFISANVVDIAIGGRYKRLNKKGQTDNHVIQSHIQNKYKLQFWHSESFNPVYLQVSDSFTITDDLGNVFILSGVSLETTILPNLTYQTVITATIYDEFNEVCNVSSDYVFDKNVATPSLLVNSLVSVVDKPSYVGIISTTDTGTKARFTLPYTELLNNIAVNDYLYLHGNFDFYELGLQVVKLITKTASLLTFEGSVAYTTYSAESNQHITLNFEPVYADDVLVVERSLTTTLFTDFIPNFSTITEEGGKKIEVTQGKELATTKVISDILTVPIIVIDSELWKIKQMYKADSLSFVYDSNTYYSFNNSNFLTEKGNDNLFGVKEYELNLTYNQEVISTNH